MNVDQTLEYLRNQLHWPIPEDDELDKLTFEYDRDELGLKPNQAQKLQNSKILQLRPLPNAPTLFGIFLIQFNQAKLPIVLLRRILNALIIKKRKSEEPRRWNLADLLFISTFQPDEKQPTPQPDNPNLLFALFHQNPKTNETPTLHVLGWNGDDTKLKTDYIKEALKTHLQWPENPANINHWREQWTKPFKHKPGHTIRTAKQLAEKLAELAKNIRNAATDLMQYEDATKGKLRKLHKAFQTALIQDLTTKDFADTYAQTIAYGLLTIAITKPDKANALSQDQLHDLAPIANPFLREMLKEFLHANGNNGQLNFDELGAQNIIDLLQSKQTDLQAILRDFGRRKQDPALHFYEDFLHFYDPKTKFQRGVFYTPKPIVQYIVRNIHQTLQTEFNLPDGLASTITWRKMIAQNLKIQLPSPAKPDEHFVQILDPATGTATFLVEVIDTIHQHLTQKWKAEGKAESERKDNWQNYVPQHLLPRLYGYEIMMAPYAVAHMKISLKLQETGYQFPTNQADESNRTRIYLTNALEPHQKQLTLPDFEPLAQEAQAVNEVKKSKRFTILIGNPPYAVKSANKGEWISKQVRDNYYPQDEIKERNPGVISDDYVKFFRFVEYTLDTTGIGILGFITNHAWIDNPTFRRMRQSMLDTFSNLRILDLHGNTRKKETAPDGGKDQNVFDIMQGVAITIASKSPAVQAQVFHSELYGIRKTKETELSKPQNPTHSKPKPNKPFHFFIPKDDKLREEYETGKRLEDVFQLRLSGIDTNRDAITIHESKEKLWQVVQDFASLSEEEARKKYALRKDTQGWQLKRAQKDLRKSGPSKDKIQRILYRPFDKHYTYYTGRSGGFMARPKHEVMRHMIERKNIGLVTVRQIKSGQAWRHCWVTDLIIESCYVSNYTSERNYLFPLYLYPGKSLSSSMIDSHRRPNFSLRFLAALSNALGLPQSDESDNHLPSGVLPEDIFGYIYAVLHSPEYRRRYAPFLRIDFPRIPLPKSLKLFRQLATIGQELVSYHLLSHSNLQSPAVQFSGHPQVLKVGWTKDNGGAVWLDGKGNRANFKKGTSGFAPVPEAVWKHHVGGYQVCEKWLKDRIAKKGEPPRILSDEEILHYRRIVTSISATLTTMRKIGESC